MTAPPARPSPRWRLALKAGGALVAVVVAVAGALFLGFLWFVATLPTRVDDLTTRTDAIVVLTGGSERLSTGLTLLQDGLAPRLFVSGVHRGVDLGDLLKQARPPQGELPGVIVLGHAADDTVGNASETAQWVGREHVASLRLVTGAYHMPRSLVEFRHAMPGVTIISHPVFPDTVKSHEWWRWPGTAALLATEYSKYLAAEIRQWFLPRKPSP
ncbi:MAG TPA: YdcF family protein [Magnetospirillum sp.]|nr:YdcF family protein [Magnetospirillum sp.]